MGVSPTQFSGFILDRTISGEKFWRVTILTAEYGVKTCLVRVAGKNKTTCVPDLFDEAEILLGNNKNGTENDLSFAKEYRLVRRNCGISRNYTALVYASKFAGLIAKNAFPADASTSLFKLCSTAMHAFSEKPHADATYFKALWTLAKGSGYPVKEDWLENSRFEDREASIYILKTPIEQLDIEPRDVAHCTRRLEAWLTNEHQFIIG